MKKVILGFLFICLSVFVSAQTYNIATQDGNTGVNAIETCSGTFTDSNAGTGSGGYPSNSYINNEDYTVTFCPSTPGDVIRLDFTQFCVKETNGNSRTCEDWLYVYQGNVDPSTATEDDVYCGTLTGANLPVITSTSIDGCITFRFQSTNDNKVDCGWSADITCLTSCQNPIADLVDQSDIQVCPSTADNPGSMSVSLDASSSSVGSYIGGTTQNIASYQWDWGDGTVESTTSALNSHTYASEGIYIAKLTVIDDNTDLIASGCQSSNPMTRTVKILPAASFTGTTASPVAITCADNVTLTGVSTSQTRTQSLPGITSGTVALPDGNGDSYISGANYSGLFPDGELVAAGCYPSICFDLEHSFARDLTIDLIAPDGKTVRLYNRELPSLNNHMFGSCANAADDGVQGCPASYCVDPTSTNLWTSTTTRTLGSSTCGGFAGPCEAGGYYFTAGTFQSSEPFSQLDGAPLNGTWTIKVTDNQSLDDGTLFGWSLSFPSDCYIDLVSETPDISSTTWSTVDAGPAVPAQSTIIVTVTDPGPDACPDLGTCFGTELTNEIILGPFNAIGDFVYDLEAVDEFGCEYTENVTVSVSGPCGCPVSGSAGAGGSVCVGSDFSLNGSETGATSYIWTSSPAGAAGDLSATNILNPVFTPTTDYGGTVDFILSLTDGSCTITETVNITVNDVPNVDAGLSQIICSGGTANVTATGANNYFWDNGIGVGAVQALSPASTTVYNVTGTDSNSCENLDAVTITVQSAMTVTEASASITCNGANDGEVNITVSGGSGAYTFNWSNGSTTEDISSLSANTYSVTISDGTCSVTTSETVNEPTALNISSSATSVTCNGESNGAVNITVSGGSSSYTFTWSNSSTTEGISSLVANTYAVTVSDGNCNITASETVNEPTALSISSLATSVSCDNGNDGAVNITVSGGLSSYTFNWSNGSSTKDIPGLVANTYSVTVSDGNCNITASETVSEPGPITITPTITDAACGATDGSLVIGVTSNATSYSYEWSNNETTQNITGLGAGTFTVTVTSNLGCVNTNTSAVTNPSPTITVTVDNEVSCFAGNNGAASVAASGGNTPYTYLWDNSLTAASTGGLNAGLHYVTVTDATPCVGIQPFTITEPTSITANISTTNVACNGESNGAFDLSVSGGTSPYTFAWSDGATTEDVTGLEAGTYSLYVIDDNNCDVEGNQMITSCVELTGALVDACGAEESDNEMIRLQVGPNPLDASNMSVTWPSQSWNGMCQDASTATIVDNLNSTIIGGGQIIEPSTVIPAYSNVIVVSSDNFDWADHDWSGLDYNLYIIFQCDRSVSGWLSQGTNITDYTINVDFGSGCSDAASYVPNDLLGINRGVGIGGDGVDFAADGTPSYYNNLCTPPTNAQIEPLTFQITEPSALTLTEVSSNDVLCNGESTGNSEIVAAGGTISYTYSWSNGSSLLTATGLSNGTYTATVSDANSCLENITITINEPTLFSGSIACTSVTAIGGSDGTSTGSASGGTTGYTYTWDVSGSTTNSITGLFAGNVNATITDANGCSVTDACTIIEPGCSVTLAVTTTDVTCNGLSDGLAVGVLSGGTTNYSFVWSSSSNTTNTETGLAPAVVHNVTATDGNGCFDFTTITLGEPTALTGSIACTSVTLSGGTDGSVAGTTSGGITPYVYTWNVSGNTTSSVTGLSTGVVNATITDDNGCYVTDVCTITEPSCNLTLTVAVTPTLCNGVSNGIALATTTGGSNYSYSWSTSGNTTDTENSLAPSTGYSVTVNDMYNCTTTDSYTITEPADITVSAAITQQLSCNSSSNGIASISGIGGTTPYIYLWSNGETNKTNTGLTEQVYSVTLSDVNSCSKSAAVGFSAPSPLVSSIGATDVLCNNTSTGEASITVTGGSQPYTYSWDGGTTVSTTTGLAANTYSVTITDNNSCSLVDGYTVSEPSALSLSTTTTFADCGGGTNGTATVISAGGTTPYNYFWINFSQTTQIATGFSAGVHAVSVTDDNSCQETVNALVSNPAPSLIVTAVTSITCNGGSEGAISIAASGGLTPYTFYWGPETNTTGSVSGLIAGTYNVTVDDNSNCRALAGIDILEPNLLTITSATSDVSCFGMSDGSLDISPVGGTTPYTYSWSTGQTTQDLTGLVPGIYDFELSDANTCSTGGAVQPNTTISTCVEIRSILIDACHDDNNLEGQDEMFFFETGNGPLNVSDITITWGSANTWEDVCTANTNWINNTNLLITGGGSVTALNPGEIIPAYSKVLFVTNTILDQSFNDLSSLAEDIYVIFQCTGNDTGHFGNGNGSGVQSLTLNFGSCSDAVSYDRDLLIDINGTTGGTSAERNGATVLYQDDGTATYINNGCIAPISSVTSTPSVASISFTVTEPVLLSVSVSSMDISCNGLSDGQGVAAAAGGTTSYSYLWSNNETTQTASALVSGTNTVVVSDANNCTVTESVTISEPSTLTVSTSVVNIGCSGSSTDGEATAIATGGTTGYSFVWDDGSSQTTQTAVGLLQGNYNVTVLDANNCFQIGVASISTTAGITVSSIGSDASCAGTSDGSITITTNGGTTPYLYSWSGNTQTTGLISGLTSGGYTVSIQDAGGCRDVINETLSAPNAISPTVNGTDIVCNGGASGEASVSVLGGTTPYSYSWNDSNGQTVAVAGDLIAAEYIVTIADDNGCEVQLSVTLSEPSAITVSSNVISDADCYGTSTGEATIIALGGTSPYSYSWSNGESTQLSMNLNAGTHTITITDGNNCVRSTTLTIAEPAQLFIGDVFTTNASCEGLNDGSVQVSITGGNTPYNYTWSNNSSDTVLVGVAEGVYGVTVIDNEGCTLDSTEIVVNVYEPLADFTWTAESFVVPAEVEFTNLSSGADYFVWSFGTGLNSDGTSPTYTYQEAGEYEVILTAYVDSLNLCEDSAVHVVVIEEEPSYQIAEVFSPNNDDQNDIFTINGINIAEIEGFIYNRWGTEIYKWETIQGGWDGRTYAGEEAPEGTYFYVITIKVSDSDQPLYPFAGSLTLVR